MTQDQMSAMTRLRQHGYPCEYVRRAAHGAIIVSTPRRLRPGVLTLQMGPNGVYVDTDSIDAARQSGRTANMLYSQLAQNAGSWRNG